MPGVLSRRRSLLFGLEAPPAAQPQGDTHLCSLPGSRPHMKSDTRSERPRSDRADSNCPAPGTNELEISTYDKQELFESLTTSARCSPPESRHPYPPTRPDLPREWRDPWGSWPCRSGAWLAHSRSSSGGTTNTTTTRNSKCLFMQQQYSSQQEPELNIQTMTKKKSCAGSGTL